MRTSKVVVIAAFIATLACVSACGADGDDSLSASTTVTGSQPDDAVTYPANGETADVLAIDNNFLPQPLEIVAGTEVVFTNNGRNPHNVLPEDDPKATTWGVLEADFLPEDTYSHVFDTPGTYVYYCSIHGSATAGMSGTIVVTAP